MDTMTDLRNVAEDKRRENRVLALAYSKTLSWLVPANFVLVVGAALLSLVAGATILVDNQWLTKVESGLLALVAGAFTIVHSKLGCESYQAECRKLAAFHRGMAIDYEDLRIVVDEVEFRKRLGALNAQASATAKSASVEPFESALARARRSVGGAAR